MVAPRTLLNPIFEDEGLTRGLGDAEARILVDWLVDRAELIYHKNPVEENTRNELGRICRRARSIVKFVVLWSESDRGAACQLAATERFAWPLPESEVDPADLMHAILGYEQGSA